jgi:hypothetical protein
MGSADYHFVTRWDIEGSIDEIAGVLFDAQGLERWWPSVYLKVAIVEPGDPKTSIGRVVDLYTKGWLPYTLRWSFRVTESDAPRSFALEAFGDFEGVGRWTLTPRGASTHVEYDWRIRAEKPLLKWFSFLMKPLFRANHEWAMRKGEESLLLELRRRRGEKDVPPAPGATFHPA